MASASSIDEAVYLVRRKLRLAHKKVRGLEYIVTDETGRVVMTGILE